MKREANLTGEEHNSNGKRTLPFTGNDQSNNDSKDAETPISPIVPYTNKKLRSLMTDRQEKTDK